MSRKVVFLEGTICDCKCDVHSAPHLHTIQHGEKGDTGPSGSSRINSIDINYRYFPMETNVTNIIEYGCKCSPTMKGIKVIIDEHVHVKTIGPKGIQGIAGTPIPDLGMLDRRYIIIVKDCKSCIHEKEPHDHAVLEGIKGDKGPYDL